MVQALRSDADWEMALSIARETAQVAGQAVTFLQQWGTASKPVLVRCDDGSDYVLKGRQTGKQAVNDQIVGKLGELIGAPTGRVTLVEVPQELLDIEPQMGHLSAGFAHASQYVQDSTEREALIHTAVEENRPRFALLAVLYGWVDASDHQFIYANTGVPQVTSVDHGHFFPGGPDWTLESLAAAAPATIDQVIAAECLFETGEIEVARVALQAVGDGDIANAVGAPPEDWAITGEERVGLAKYLSTRRDELVASMAA